MSDMKNADLSFKTLIIRLGCHTSDPIYWYTEMVEGEHSNSGRLCDHSELGNIPFLLNYDVKILVSTSHIIFRKIDIIEKSFLKKEQSLAFSIEKTIVSNIEDFHTVILKSDSDFCYIAAVEHKLMSRWLGWLENVGVSPTAMIPDVLALPFNDERCFPVKLDDEWLIRNSEVSGFVVKDAIFKGLCLSPFHFCSKNRFSHFYSRTSCLHSTDYCDALCIMASNIKNNHVNLLTGRYYCHGKKSMRNDSLFRSACLFLLLAIVMFFNLWFHKKDMLKDIHILNLALHNFHIEYPLVQQYINVNNLNKVDDFSHSVENVVKPDFINLLHGMVENFIELDVNMNSIVFAKDENKASFNINVINRYGVEQVLNKIDRKAHQLNISKITNNDGTSDIIFEYSL